MKKEYNLENIKGQDVIWYEENGVRYSFTADSSNRDYQIYLESLNETPTK